MDATVSAGSGNVWKSQVRASLLALAAALIVAPQAAEAATQRPNFLVIVADDLGFSDLGAFGGEICTPNLDKLAGQGVRFTDFYVGATCSPTRAMLMTGMDNHRVGLGNMYEQTAPNQLGRIGYTGVLSTQVPTIAERLRGNGYHTYMAGKWHLGHAPDHIPHARGFERDFTLINAAGSHFDMTGSAFENEVSEFTEDGKYIKKLPPNYYSTRTYTEKMVSFMEKDRADGRPFFAYLAYQAPHDPLQVPDDWLWKYKGKYDYGWDWARAQRLQRMKKMGLVAPTAQLPPRLWYIPEFADLLGAAQVQASRRMEVYAAMVEYLDYQVGEMLKYLEKTGQLDNTVILFFSDNGPEGNDPIQNAKQRKALAASAFYPNNYDTHFEAWGRSYSYVAYGAAWAQVSATPFNAYKGSAYEGGIRSPLIVWQKGMKNGGTINRQAVMHVMDIAPTLADLAGTGKAGMQGRSWVPLLGGNTSDPRADGDVLGGQYFGARMVRSGSYKAVWMPKPFGFDRWELFDVRKDPGETRDLSQSHPSTRKALIAAYERYERTNGVILPNRSFYDGLEQVLPPRPPVPASGFPRGQEPNYSKSN